MTLLSYTAYAKHRGVSPQRINALKKRGRLIVVDGKVDKEASDRLLSQQPENYRGGERGGSRSKAAKAQDAANGGASGLPEAAPQGMATSVAMKEFYLSKLRQVEYDEKLGLLVDVEAVAEEVAAIFATVRNLLLGLPAKVAPRVIHCETAEAARGLLLAEVQGILRELSAEPDDDDEVE